MANALHIGVTRATRAKRPAEWLGRAGGVFPIAVVLVIAVVLAGAAIGHASIADTKFDAALGRYGLAPLVAGTLLTTALALVVAAPAALVAAIWLSELAPPRLRRALRSVLEGAAAVPTVVYGFWGRLVVVPFMRDEIEPRVSSEPHGHGFGLASAACVLAAMALPTIAAQSLEVLRSVPDTLRMTAFSLGASRFRVVRDVVLPAARRGLLGAIALGAGRAVGESIAVAMVIGGRTATPSGFFDATSTLTASLVDGYVDATHPDHVAALAAVALAVAMMGAFAVAFARRWLTPIERRP
jgi:phosphate transport system permease protein